MELYEAVRYARSKLKMTQSEVCEGIISTTSYSRFEKGTRSLTLDQFEKILDRLGLQLNDINDIQKEQDTEITYVINQINLGLADKLPESELTELYQYTKQLKDKSLVFLRYYYLTCQYFHKKNKSIPSISEADTKMIFERIKKSQNITSTYLQFIIDFMTYFTDDQVIYLGDNLLKNIKYPQLSLNARYITRIPDALINLTDTYIDRGVKASAEKKEQFFSRVQPILSALLSLLETRFQFNYIVLYKLQKYRYKYYTATNESELEHARNELKEYLVELEQIDHLSILPNNYARISMQSIENLLKNDKPSEHVYYIIN